MEWQITIKISVFMAHIRLCFCYPCLIAAVFNRFAYPNYEVAIGMNEEYDPKMTLMSGIQIKKTAVLAKCSKYHNKIITIMCLLNFGYK